MKPHNIPIARSVTIIEKLRIGSLFVLMSTNSPMPELTRIPESIDEKPIIPSVHKSAIRTLDAQFGMRPTREVIITEVVSF